MNKNKWEDSKYQRISFVEVKGGSVIVTFQDGTIVDLEQDSILPPNVHSADWGSLQFNPYEIIIPTSMGQTEIPWSTIRLMNDAKFAFHWAQKAEKQASEIGQRLRELRKSRNLSSKEVAERAGISPQSLSRIEKGHHDVVFTTLQKLLAAMGCTLQDLANVEIVPTSINALIKRLESAGLKKEWLVKRILPEELINKIDSSEYEDLTAEILKHISRIYDWLPSEILGTSPLVIDRSVIQFAKFKTGARVQEKQTSAYTLYAHYLSLLVVQAIGHIKYEPLPKEAAEIRNQIAHQYGPLNLENVLRYIWDHGIPVIPLNDSGAFHGACWNISGRSVIVLKQVTPYQGRWLYDVLHELGHVTKHLSNNQTGIVEDKEISPFEDSEEEWEANELAEDLIFSSRAEELAEKAVERAQNKVEYLKSAVLQMASNEHIPVDLLANYLAFRLSTTNNINWWGTANNLQVTEPSPLILAKQILLERIRLEKLTPEDQDILMRALA